MVIPQIVKTIKTKDTSGVSLLFFIIYLMANIIALVYAFLIYQPPLIIKYVIAILTTLLYIVLFLVYFYRKKRLLNKACTVLWFTGLSGSGKSTIACALKEYLELVGKKVKILDGDDVRSTLHEHLGFTPEDIKENNFLIAKLAKEQMKDFNFILIPIISPFRDSRILAKKIIGETFIELYVECSENIRVARDPKGLYRLAQSGTLSNLIGYRDGVVYEVPEKYDIKVNTDTKTITENINHIISFIM